MTKRSLLIILSAVMSLVVITSVYAKEKDTSYNWHGYELSYPSGWKITADKDIPDGGRVVVLNQNKENLEVVVGMFDKFSAEDAKKEKLTPARLAMTFGIPMALKLAGKNESAISISYGSVGLSDVRNLSTRFTIALPNIPDVYNIECFSSTTGSKLFAGAIKSSSKKGHVPEDDGSYRKAFQEAYHIIKSITTTGQKIENEKEVP